MEKSIVINAPVDEVYAYLEDPMKNVEWLTSLKEIKEVTGEGLATRFRWVCEMAGISLEGETTVLELVPNQRMVTQSTGGVASTWTFSFAAENGGTRLDLAVDYTVPIPVLGKLAEALVVRQNDKELETAVANIKARIEG